jgi:hypothetical protein
MAEIKLESLVKIKSSRHDYIKNGSLGFVCQIDQHNKCLSHCIQTCWSFGWYHKDEIELVEMGAQVEEI